MKTKQALVCGALLIGAALLYALILYPRLPDLIPIHWNIRGEVDGWAEKRWAVLMMPGMMTLLVGMMLVLPAMSPRQFRVESFLSTFNYLMIVCTALMGYIHLVMLQAALHPELDMGRALISGIFLFLALTGNVLGRVRRNFWMGVRTPWTLASDRVWVATHRLTGRLMVGAGIAGAIAIWLGVPIALCFTLLILALLAPVVYSYLLYHRWNGDRA